MNNVTETQKWIRKYNRNFSFFFFAKVYDIVLQIRIITDFKYNFKRKFINPFDKGRISHGKIPLCSIAETKSSEVTKRV